MPDARRSELRRAFDDWSEAFRVLVGLGATRPGLVSALLAPDDDARTPATVHRHPASRMRPHSRRRGARRGTAALRLVRVK